jgi:hypothetical protein
MSDLVGKSFTFDDDSKIEVIQVKKREENTTIVEVVTYNISQGRSLPRKLVMEKSLFIQHFGHLFKE